MKREGNILSPILRQAWDGSPLHPLTKTSPIRCDEPHLSIIGHITPEELRKQLNEIEIANGFANRFMWFYVQRSKLLPSTKGVPLERLQPLIDDLMKAVSFARSVKAMMRDPATETLWEQAYRPLTEDRFGLYGVITQRAAPHVLRLSMIYALMDQSSIIKKPHLEAALALWDYSEQSVKMIFEDMTGDANVDLVLKCGRAFKKISRTEMWALVGRSSKKEELDRIVKVIVGRKQATLDPQGNLNFR
jgi:DNA replicative helicase MCM subunit Mcm2 (Cdc46/Mcm family)